MHKKILECSYLSLKHFNCWLFLWWFQFLS